MILELQYDPRVWPHRTDEFWHRDVWERERGEEMNRRGKGTPDQVAAQRRIDKQFGRRPAIVEELAILLTILTKHLFFLYGSEQHWFIPLDRSDPSPSSVWGQMGYRLPELTASRRDFSIPTTDPAPMVPANNYYKQFRDQLVSGKDFRIQLPDILDDLLDRYFALAPEKKQPFYAACRLCAQSDELRVRAPSLSLVAAASAIETLVNFEYPSSPQCPRCNTLEPIEWCGQCGAPQYHLGSRFREFIQKYGGRGPEVASFARRFYKVRSGISHAGNLLRVEFHDSGFHSGGEDEQMLFTMGALRIPFITILNWLLSVAPTESD